MFICSDWNIVIDFTDVKISFNGAKNLDTSGVRGSVSGTVTMFVDLHSGHSSSITTKKKKNSHFLNISKSYNFIK